jgi:hypothetical protein
VNFTRDDQFAQVAVYDATLQLYMPQFLDIKIDYPCLFGRLQLQSLALEQ